MITGGVRAYLWGGICATGLCFAFIELNGYEDGRIFWHLLKIHDQVAAGLMMCILLSALIAARFKWLERVPVDEFLGLLERQKHLIALILWIALSIGTKVIYRDHPLAMDEYAALFQAKIFAAGSIHGQFPPDLIDVLIPPGFQGQFLVADKLTGEVYSAYWPGFSLLLAPFVALGAPWACNPTIVALSVLLIARIARDTVDVPHAAGWALLFALASPVLLINGLSYYSMPAHLLLNLAFAWLLLVPTNLRIGCAGLVGGLALCLHNPLPHMAFALPWLVWLARHRGGRALMVIAGGYLPLFLLLGVAWVLGHAGTPLAGIVSASGPGTTASDRALTSIQAIATFLRFPDGDILLVRAGGFVKLWLWASPLMLILAYLGFRQSDRPGIRLFGYSALSTAIAYFAIRFDQGHGWGYRYFHGAWGVLPVLAALGVRRLTERLEGGVRIEALILVVTLMGLIFLGALRTIQVGDFVATHLEQRPPIQSEGRQILVYKGAGYFGLDLIQNDPWLRDPTISLLRPPRDAEDAVVRATLPGGYVVRQNGFGRSYWSRDHAEKGGSAGISAQ
ncbi:hypothetical protein [Sulfuritalea sp.]|uniref:hypothetical protein n=1 Tax=Sulfuritalea sp. TaxID=2480090 RepID=UPI001ACB054C|nr:hypothetical protein [Sulfuritalea sp.]MBN8473473.1 hypothetical protein [Sulfuritalea sp.]